jgi:hypothetical protein
MKKKKKDDLFVEIEEKGFDEVFNKMKAKVKRISKRVDKELSKNPEVKAKCGFCSWTFKGKYEEANRKFDVHLHRKHADFVKKFYHPGITKYEEEMNHRLKQMKK